MIRGRIVIITALAALPSWPLVLRFSTLLFLLLLTTIMFFSPIIIGGHRTFTDLLQAWAFEPTDGGNQTGATSPLSATLSSNTTTATEPPPNGTTNQAPSTNTTISQQAVSGGNISRSEDGIIAPTGNDPPEAHDMTIQRNDLSAVAIDLNGTDADIGDRLTFIITLDPQSGNITQFDPPSGFLVYTPYDLGNNRSIYYVGSDFFRYMVTDNSGTKSKNATVSVQYCPIVADC